MIRARKGERVIKLKNGLKGYLVSIEEGDKGVYPFMET
jgi:hypothetical protein